jgi:polysaccharide deacetylase 2 family uncharacterized protein YibQ
MAVASVTCRFPSIAMTKRKSGPPTPSRRLLWIGAAALVLFAAGEAFVLARTDSGRLTLASLGLGSPARVVQIVGRNARHGLATAGVAPDSVRESVIARPGDGPRVRWRVGLREDASLTQTNYAVSHAVESAGGRVFSGRERWGDGGQLIVTLVVGHGAHPTHEISLVRAPPAPAEQAGPEPARLALVLFGFGDDAEFARGMFGLPVPFAAAIVAGTKHSPGLFRGARDRDRECVLHLPLEPVNYPQVNPGPGTITVTMRPAQITGLVRRYLDQSGDVVAVANHMGSLATQDMAVMTAVYRELKRQKLHFIHVTPAAGAVCKSLSSDQGVLYDEPGAVIDFEARGDDRQALDKRWRAVLAEARERGRMTVWIRATPLTRAWLVGATTPKKLDGVSLVPLSSVLRRPAAL